MPISTSKSDRPNCEYDRRVGLRLPASLHASIERTAASRGIPVSMFVRAALRREVEMNR